MTSGLSAITWACWCFFSSVALIVPLVTAIVFREWIPASHYLLSIGLSLIVGSALRFLRIEPGA